MDYCPELITLIDRPACFRTSPFDINQKSRPFAQDVKMDNPAVPLNVDAGLVSSP